MVRARTLQSFHCLKGSLTGSDERYNITTWRESLQTSFNRAGFNTDFHIK